MQLMSTYNKGMKLPTRFRFMLKYTEQLKMLHAISTFYFLFSCFRAEFYLLYYTVYGHDYRILVYIYFENLPTNSIALKKIILPKPAKLQQYLFQFLHV